MGSLAVVILVALVGILSPIPAAADLSVQGKIPLFANDGEQGELAAHVSDSGRPMDDAVVLFEVYLAPEGDARPHDVQMQEMKEIQAGKKPAPVFRLGDIALTGEPTRLVGAPRGNGLYGTPYRFPHGRIFVKVTAIADGKTVVSPTLYSTRVHCDQVNLDGFDRQKEFLDQAREIVRGGHFPMLERVAAAMRKDLDTGHSMRYMVTHHEKDPRAYDDGLTALAQAARSRDGAAALAALDTLEAAYVEALKTFLLVELKSDTPATAGRRAAFRLTMRDPINDHPLRTTLVVVQPGIDRAAETRSRSQTFHQKLMAGPPGHGRSAHPHHGAAAPAAVPPGIVPRTNPDGSLGFLHAFDAPGESTIRLKIYYDGREFTHDLPLTVLAPGN